MAAAPATETGFPRVSGDEPIVKGYITYAMGFSPRERG